MEKLIVEEICKKYGKSKILIKKMIKDTLKQGYSIENTLELIDEFYHNKSMQ